MRVSPGQTAIVLVALALAACAGRLQLPAGSRDAQLTAVLEEIADRPEQRAWQQAIRSGRDSMDAFLERFWTAHDPTPGTPANEFRDRIIVRLEIARRQFALDRRNPGPADDRLVPFVVYGPPREIETDVIGPGLFYEYWIWRPDPRAVLAGRQDDRLGRLEFAIGFAVSWNGSYDRSRESWNWDPPPGRLRARDRERLAELLADPENDRFLRAAVLWRLDMDRESASLAVMLDHAADPDWFLRQTVAEALQPLQLRLFPDGTFSTELTAPDQDQGQAWVEATKPVRLDAPPRRSSTPEPLEPAVRANLLVSVYEPARELSPDDVATLRREKEMAEAVPSERGWLTAAEADSLYVGPLAQARSLLDAGGGDEAHTLLDPLLRDALSDDAEAWHLDALALLASAEPGGRQLAETRVREALRRDPGNIRYHLTLARIYKSRTLDRYADAELERLLDASPALADAYALRGVLRLEAYWAKGWRAGGWGGAIDEEGMPLEVSRALAMEQLHKALVLDPDNEFATWWLGVHYLSVREWTTAVSVMSYLVRERAHVPEALLARGLAFQQLGMLEQAWADYQAGLDRLPVSVRILTDDPRWVLPLSKGGYGLGDAIIADPLTTVAATRDSTGRDRFWRAKDQLFATALNERMLEQYRRFAHVTWHFANPTLGLRGWETHRGRVYLRYGDPIGVDDQSDETQQRTLGRIDPEREQEESAGLDWVTMKADQLAFGVKETWQYPDLKVTFSGGNVSGEVTVSRPGEFTEYMERRPEGERVVGMRPILPVEASWYRFQGVAGRPEYVAVALAPPLGGRPGQPPPPGPESSPVHLILLDGDWNPVRRVEAGMPRSLRLSGYRPTWVGPLLTLPVEYPTDAARFAALEVTGEGDIPSYAARDTLTAPGPGSPLRLSDLVIASNIVPVPLARTWPAHSYFTRGQRAIVPLPSDHFGLGEPLLVYLEVYGLAKDEIGATGYQVAFTVTMLDDRRAEEPTIEGLMGRLVGTDRRQGSVTLRFDYEDIRSDTSAEMRVVFPSGRFSDRYRITIEVSDKISGARAEVARVLTVDDGTGR